MSGPFCPPPAVFPPGHPGYFDGIRRKEDRRGYDHTLWLYNPENGELSPLPGTENYKTACWESEHTLLFPSEQTDELKELREKGEEITPILRYDCTTGEKTELFRVPYVVTSAQPAAGGVLLCIDYDNARPDLSALSGDEREKALAAIREEKITRLSTNCPTGKTAAAGRIKSAPGWRCIRAGK